MTKSSVFRSGGYGGIKPLNAPRVVYVRTDSAGTPVAVQVPPAITLAPGVRGELGRASHFTFPRSLPSRKGGSEAPGVPIQSGPGRAGRSAGRARARERGQASSLVSDGRWVKVTKVDDLWKVNDEWWRGPEEEIARLYYMIRLENSQQLTVYLDLITNNWYRQAG